jgi:hypothetical protein
MNPCRPGQGITDRQSYFNARRVGRGVPLNRAKRAEAWVLIENFQRHLRAENVMTFTQAAAIAAGPTYRHAADPGGALSTTEPPRKYFIGA